mgnify:CR=1 FL=1
MNKKTWREKLMTVATGIIALGGSFLAALVANGFDFDTKFWLKPSFWASTLVTLGLSLYVFNFSLGALHISLKANKNGDYYKTKARENDYVKYTRNNQFEDILDAHAEKETEDNRKSIAQSLLDNITSGLRVENIENLDNEDNIAINRQEFKKFCKKRGLRWFKRWRLKVAIKRVINGKYNYVKVRSNDVLVNNSRGAVEQKVYTISETKQKFRANRKKIISFLISTVIINSLIWNGVDSKFFATLFTQSSLIISSYFSAYTTAVGNIADLTTVSENRCDFFNNALKYQLREKPLVRTVELDN